MKPHLVTRDPKSSDHLVRKVVAEIGSACMEGGENHLKLYALENGLGIGLAGDNALLRGMECNFLQSSFDLRLTFDLWVTS